MRSISITSGFGVTRWNFDRDGVRYRQMSSGATLFVPSDATAIELPYRLQWGRDPVTLQLDFRGRTADRLVVSDHRVADVPYVVPEGPAGGATCRSSSDGAGRATTSAVLLGKM